MQTVDHRVYGPINFSGHELALLQDPNVQRLKQVSHCAIPSNSVCHKPCASKFEHTAGVMHLTRQLDIRDQDLLRHLVALAAFHDAGSPAFTHCAEQVLKRLHGLSHEDLIIQVLQDSTPTQAMLKQLGIEFDYLLKLFLPGLGDLVLGAIGTDNIDGPPLFGRTMELNLGLLPVCDPLKVSQGFCLHQNEIVFKQSHLKEMDKLLLCRKHVYSFIFSQPFMSAWAMLTRALELASQTRRLTVEFFLQTDSKMWQYLLDLKDMRINRLLKELEQSTSLYHLAFNQAFPAQPIELTEYDCRSDPIGGQVAREIAQELKLPIEAVCFSVRLNTGPRELRVPILIRNNPIGQTKARQNEEWHVMVFIAPEFAHRSQEVEVFTSQLLNSFLANSPA